MFFKRVHGQRQFIVAHGVLGLFFISLMFSGCSTGDVPIQGIQEPQSMTRQLCIEGKYHSAMKELIKTQVEWEEYTKSTGRTCEGAAGFEYYETMGYIVTKGDADWGHILDDPTIPYTYKTGMIFEILEQRLGKGAVYMGSDRKSFIMPRFGLADLDAVMAARAK